MGLAWVLVLVLTVFAIVVVLQILLERSSWQTILCCLKSIVWSKNNAGLSIVAKQITFRFLSFYDSPNTSRYIMDSLFRRCYFLDICCTCFNTGTQWGRNKMDGIAQRKFSNAFSWFCYSKWTVDIWCCLAATCVRVQTKQQRTGAFTASGKTPNSHRLRLRCLLNCISFSSSHIFSDCVTVMTHK